MKIEQVLSGFTDEAESQDGLRLAMLLAEQARARLTVATVQPPPWTTPGPGRADESAWLAYLKEEAALILDQAREVAGPQAEYLTLFHRGSGRGLVELARQVRADVVVVGSASQGLKGRISLGSTADQLLHASSVAVMLAPRGYARDSPHAFERITVAYRRGPGCDRATQLAATIAASLGVPLRLVTLMFSGGRPPEIEELMLERRREQTAADLRAAASGHREVEVTGELLEGRNVADALGRTEWLPGELLVCASSDSGPLRRVFLGDTSIKIICAVSCPVMVLTRQPV